MGNYSQILGDAQSDARTVPLGGLRDAEYKRLCAIYEFQKMSGWFRDPNGRKNPRVTPTDLDSRFFVDRRGSFLWLEFKTGTQNVDLNSGQMRAFKALLWRGRPKDMLAVCTHPAARHVDVPQDITAFTLVKYDQPISANPPQIFTTPQQSGEELLMRWFAEWELHCFEKPNNFVNNFRAICGVYKRELQWSYATLDDYDNVMCDLRRT